MSIVAGTPPKNVCLNSSGSMPIFSFHLSRNACSPPSPARKRILALSKSSFLAGFLLLPGFFDGVESSAAPPPPPPNWPPSGEPAGTRGCLLSSHSFSIPRADRLVLRARRAGIDRAIGVRFFPCVAPDVETGRDRDVLLLSGIHQLRDALVHPVGVGVGFCQQPPRPRSRDPEALRDGELRV